jgi:hypothetical protein
MHTHQRHVTPRPEAALPVGTGGLLEPSAGSRVAEATVPAPLAPVSGPIGADE